MARENARFAAVETVQRPVWLKFKTKSDKTVFIRALKIVKKK
jgi:hypothetical protein